MSASCSSITHLATCFLLIGMWSCQRVFSTLSLLYHSEVNMVLMFMSNLILYQKCLKILTLKFSAIIRMNALDFFIRCDVCQILFCGLYCVCFGTMLVYFLKSRVVIHKRLGIFISFFALCWHRASQINLCKSALRVSLPFCPALCFLFPLVVPYHCTLSH